ncbi:MULTISPECIES: MarR family winged helix-turn-helix transcriptional regulator [Streptococcus]|uniref:MarR family winged helix-turn-helix transcriptional regulator n=1 Tax=Streptococcus caledonicus TaxID=2614158 RepID=A0ABW0UE68_9STRE|nr:MarR family transcriptional regulator [Streptococcus sp. S784/96/1]
MKDDLVLNAYVRSMDEQYSLYEWFARQYGLQWKSMQILFWVKNYPAMTGRYVTQKVLTQKTYSSKQVVNATIKSWKTKGFVELVENPDDKRHKWIRLTEEGEVFATTIYQKLTQMETQATATLTTDEQDLLARLTLKYNAAFKREMETVYDNL